ncbi:hypothetical protein KG089_05190 [Carnobacteriaceae bacterium zg-ZUI252]|nr:hypothetical protein [Carnobacteriaceae bacterium zg-ZUI252]
MITIKYEGDSIDKLFSRVDTTVQRLNRHVNTIVKESSIPIKEEIERTIPVSEIMKHPNEGHAKNDVVVSNVRTSDNGYTKSVDVGFNKTEWRMWFLEFGTVKGIVGRHYVEKAMISQQHKVLEIQAKRLQEVLLSRGL